MAQKNLLVAKKGEHRDATPPTTERPSHLQSATNKPKPKASATVCISRQVADASSLCELRRTQEGGIGEAPPHRCAIILRMPLLQSHALLSSNGVSHPYHASRVFCWATPNGGERGIPIRTRMTQFLYVGVIHQDWLKGAEVTHPFKLGDSIIRTKTVPVKFKVLCKRHLLETALDWQAKRAATPHIQAVDIAQAATLSPCRVRQILRFALLHPEIRDAILELSPKQAKKRFPERLLRQWTSLAQSEQLSQFRQYIG